MAVVVGNFGLQTVTERTTRAKHIQFVSGVSVLTYWLSAFLWDLICFCILCFLLLVSVTDVARRLIVLCQPRKFLFNNLYPKIKLVKKFETTLAYYDREYIVETSLWKCSPSYFFNQRKHISLKSLPM